MEPNGRASRRTPRVTDETIFIHFGCHRNRGRDRQPNRFGIASMKRIIVIAFLFATSQAWAAQAYYSPISINSAQVPSTQTDFPVLVSITDARFKSVSNSGHVAGTSGFDIRPYTDTTLGTSITGYELERYNASTGEVVMWVKVSSLSSSTTPIVLGYGDASLTTDGSSTTTWSNSFKQVFHMKDGTTLSLKNSVTGNNATNTNTVTAGTGQIDGCGSFASASSQQLASFDPDILTATTISAWVKATTLPAAYNSPGGYDATSNNNVILVKSTGKLAMFIHASGTVSYDGSGTHTVSTGTWYLLHLVYSSSVGLIGYFNAASDATASANGNLNLGAGISPTIGNQASVSRYWNGVLDEFRTSSVVRSADWITTEYNNQSAPGTFETLGTEVAITTGAIGWFYFFP